MTTCSPILHSRSINCCKQSQGPFLSPSMENKMEEAFRIVEKISAVALGALAALTAFWLFLPSFVVGALIGVVGHKTSTISHSHHHKVESSCSHGFIEQTTGVKLPQSLALAAGVAVMAVHIDHHASVFVPIVGVTLGIWTGNLAAPSLSFCMRKFASFVNVNAY